MNRAPFNDGWQFSRAGTEEWSDVTLPHDAMIHEERTPDTPNRSHTGWFPGGRYTYRRTWTPPADGSATFAWLVFEGVYHRSTVRIDGEVAGGCLTGYTEFEVPLPMTAGEHTVEVDVDNADGPNSRWYSGSGIYRPVWLRTRGEVGFARDGVRVTLAEDGRVRVGVQLDNEASAEATVSVTLGGTSGTVRTTGATAEIVLALPDARLWSADDPHLYDLAATVAVAGDVTDTWTQRVGLRTVRAVPGEGLLVNDRPVLLRGACIHHDNGVIGAATLAASERRRVRILAEQGFNAIRMAHHPASRALLEACDELGVYVMDELTDVWFQSKTKHDLSSRFDETWPSDVDAMVAKDRNHACVIMYSTGNEIGESGTAKGVRYAHAIADRIRGLDDTRPVTAGVNAMLNAMAAKGKSMFDEKTRAKREKGQQGQAGGNAITSTGYNLLVSKLGRFMNAATKRRGVGRAVAGVADSLDVLGYNYATPRYRIDAREQPGRVIVGTETMTFDIARNWALVEKLPSVVGDFMWVGWDYLGETSLGAWNYEGNTGFSKPYPYVLAGSGALDITGHPTAPMLLARAVWGVAGGPEIAVRPVSPTGRLVKAPWRGSNGIPGWAWSGCEGRKATVEVFSSAASVELLLNGRSVGAGKAGPKHDFTATFTVPWEPGELVAVARDASGREVGRAIERSASGPLSLRLTPDRTELAADGQDAATVVIELADAAGTVELASDTGVRVEVTGPGVLQGIGSANFATPLPFDGDATRTYYGRAVAVVRTTAEPGDVTVTVHADGYPAASVTLTAS